MAMWRRSPPWTLVGDAGLVVTACSSCRWRRRRPVEISDENVKVRLHRAKGMLRAALLARVDEAAAEAFPFLGARCDRIVAAVMARLLPR